MAILFSRWLYTKSIWSRAGLIRIKGLVEAIGAKSCWLHVPARPDFVESSGLHPIYVKMIFPLNSPLLKVLMISLEAIYVSYHVLNQNIQKPESIWAWLSD